MYVRGPYVFVVKRTSYELAVTRGQKKSAEICSRVVQSISTVWKCDAHRVNYSPGGILSSTTEDGCGLAASSLSLLRILLLPK